MTEVISIPEFDKDVKQLSKKYPSLDNDLGKLIKALRFVRVNEIRGVVRISNLGEKYAKYPVYKLRSFKCASLPMRGANSGIRVIYCDDENCDQVTLIQMYHKSTTENHDIKRIYRYLDSICKE